MIKNLLSLYYYRYPKALVSLMHASHYRSVSYLKKLHKTKNFIIVLEEAAPRNRKTITFTMLLALGMLAQIAIGVLVIILGINHHVSGGIFFGAAIILLYPFVWAYIGALALILREWAKYGYNLDETN